MTDTRQMLALLALPPLHGPLRCLDASLDAGQPKSYPAIRWNRTSPYVILELKNRYTETARNIHHTESDGTAPHCIN